MSWKIFYGIEAEGPYINRETIFVEGQAPLVEVVTKCLEEECFTIYFGARFKAFELPSLVDYEVVNKLSKGYQIVVDGILNDLDFLAFIDSVAFNSSTSTKAIVTIFTLESLFNILHFRGRKENIWIKFLSMEKKRCTLVPLTSLQIPDLSLYDKDVLLGVG